MNLNEDYKKLDSMGVETSLNLFPEQIKSAFNQAMNFRLTKFTPKAVIICGMGGSSNAAKILEGLYEKDFKLPMDVDIHNDYELPIWVNNETLVVLNSYSGNTEETLSAYLSAKKVGAKVIAVTTGGKLKEMILNNEIEGVFVDSKSVNPSDYPKVGLGISFGALAGALTNIGVLKITVEELISALDKLMRIRSEWNALEISKQLYGYAPILLSGRPFLGALNAGRNAMCEIGRTFTQFYDFPEVNHVLIEAMQKPKNTTGGFKYIFFESDYLHDRVKLRINITKKILDEQGLPYLTYKLQSKSIMGQCLELAHYCAWLGFYLSILDNTDPGPEPWIIKLKELLSQQ